MTEDQVVNWIEELTQQSGETCDKWAKDHNISGAYLSDVLARKRHPGPTMLAILGLEKHVVYLPKGRRPRATISQMPAHWKDPAPGMPVHLSKYFHRTLIDQSGWHWVIDQCEKERARRAAEKSENGGNSINPEQKIE